MQAEVLAERESRTKGRAATEGVIPGRFALSVGSPDLPCPDGWQWTPLSEVAQLESGHTPSRKHPEYWDGGVPWIGIRDAVEGHGRTIDDTFQHVSDLGLANSSARLLPPRTVCLSRTASVGFVVVMGRSMATSQDFVNWVCGPGLEPEYLKYILLAERDSLLRFASGTTHQTIYYPEAKAFHALLPPLEYQRRVLAVVGVLDEKIDLNRRMNETLEEAARAIFKSWFVDFDPVRAKAEGRQPFGMNETTAALFPGKFESSQLGMVPKDWRVRQVGEVAERVAMGPFGSDIKVETFVDSGVPVISGQHLHGTLLRDLDFRFITPEHADRLAGANVQRGDVIFTHAGTIGQVALVPKHSRFDRYVISQRQFFLRCKNNEMSPRFLVYYFKSQEGRHRLLANASSTGVPSLARPVTYLRTIPVVVPSSPVLQRFDELVTALHDRYERADAESRCLTELRDYLLPKLLSGEVRVTDAEKLVGEAT